MPNWRMRRTSLFAVLSSSSRYLVSILGGYIVEWKSMSNPNLWLDRLWLPIFLMRTSRNWCDFKLHEYSPTFHKVTPYMWTICRIKNHLCRLFLVDNDIIIHNLPQVTELSFLCMYCSVSLNHTKNCVYAATRKNPITWALCSGFKHKHLLKRSLMHENPDNLSRVPILAWPGMTLSPTSHG